MLCLALSIIVIDNTILAVAFPSIQRGLHTDEAGLQWIGSSYGLVLAGLLLPLAVVGDRHGRKGMLMIGLVIFGVASVAAAFADSRAALAIARGVMGVGGACHDAVDALGARQHLSRAGTRPGDLDLVGGRGHRSRPSVRWSAALLLSRFWWGSVFLVNVPVVIVALILVARWVPRSHDPVDATGRPLERAAVVGRAHRADRRRSSRDRNAAGRSPLVLLAGVGGDRSLRRLRATRGPFVDAR